MGTSLNGKVLLVTGGTQGLGRGTAVHLAGLGHDGIVLCGRNRENGAAAEQEVGRAGCACPYVPADLIREEDCRQVVRRCDQ